MESESISQVSPVYVIVGRGTWAHRIRQILTDQNRRVLSIEEARQGPDESEWQYRERLQQSFEQQRADIAWL